MLSKEESDLLKKINRGFSENKWQRLELLNEKVEEEVLTKAAQSELEILIKFYEKYTVRRVKYLGQLATIRQITLQELMKQLGIESKHHG